MDLSSSYRSTTATTESPLNYSYASSYGYSEDNSFTNPDGNTNFEVNDYVYVYSEGTANWDTGMIEKIIEENNERLFQVRTESNVLFTVPENYLQLV